MGVCLDSQDYKDKWDQKELEANQVYLHRQERKDQMVPLDYQDLLDYQDDQEKMDQKEKTENQENKEKEELKENQEIQDLTETQVSPVLQVLLDPLERKERREIQVEPEDQGDVDSMEW